MTKASIAAELPKMRDCRASRAKPAIRDSRVIALNTAVDEKVDAIILIFVDTTRIQSALKRALAAGIQVVTLGSLKNTPETVPDVSFDWVGAGRAVAQYAVAKAGAKRVALPDGWLDGRALSGASAAVVREAELSVSGG